MGEAGGENLPNILHLFDFCVYAQYFLCQGFDIYTLYIERASKKKCFIWPACSNKLNPLFGYCIDL